MSDPGHGVGVAVITLNKCSANDMHRVLFPIVPLMCLGWTAVRENRQFQQQEVRAGYGVGFTAINRLLTHSFQTDH